MKPKKPIFGSEFSGIIEEVGKNVKTFNKGDRVFGNTNTALGCYAEFVCIQEKGFLLKLPQTITDEEAACFCGYIAAWNFLKVMANIQYKQTVLITVASGGISSAAIQIAKYFGAEVTGVCIADNYKMVQSIGADRITNNYDGFTQNRLKYDIVFDIAGKKSNFTEYKKFLTKRGIYLNPYPTLSVLFQMFWTSMFSSKKVKFTATGLRPLPELLSILNEIIKLIETKNLKIIINRSYCFEEIVEAHKYVENNQKIGDVLIALTQ